MAFIKNNGTKKKPQLHSLIDMSFILLLFFLVTSMIVQMKEKEQKLAIPTPKNESGRAQKLVQFVNQDRYLYLDESASAIVEDVKGSYDWQPVSWQRGEIMRRFSVERTMDKQQVLSNLAALKDEAKENPQATYFVLVRCPDAVPYYHVIDVIQAVSGVANIQYGCVGGSISDIQNARRIDLVIEPDERNLRRENLVIEF